MPTIANCLTYSLTTLGQCVTCNTGFSLSYDSSACVTCATPGCTSCNSNGNCVACNAALGLILQAGQCLTCNVPNCLSCNTNNSCAFDGCAYGYAYNPSSTTNQCISCPSPCTSCFSDGSCMTCSYPYSGVTLTKSNNTCFFCADSNCLSCTSNASGTCTSCYANYGVVNGACQLICPTGCQTCAGSTCTACLNFYFLQTNGTCSPCPNAPACQQCSTTNSSQCLACIVQQGFFIGSGSNAGTCQSCAAYCLTCTSAQMCQTLINSAGYVLITISSTSNNVAACDPGCSSCSANNPQICSICKGGYFLSSNNVCSPCAGSCMTCSNAASSTCLSCFPGSFLNSTSNTCVQCQLPCTSCLAGNPSACTSCAIGFLLSSNTCVNITTLPSNSAISLQNCANVYNMSSNLVCGLCLQGFTQTSGGCVPCIAGCLICNPASLTSCSFCVPGYFLNSSSVCQSCTSSCVSCTSLGCLFCQPGYIVNQNFECQITCLNPCASCQLTNPLACTSCIAGYVFSNGTCSPDTSCNANANCQVCPFGFSWVNANIAGTVSQTCLACNTSSNCARCSVSNTSQCLSCPLGSFLSNGACTGCPSGCAKCLSNNFCAYCAMGFVAQQSGYMLDNSASLYGNSATGPLTCLPCVAPCASCTGSPTTCTSCQSGFTLQAPACLSSFNFQVNVVLGVTMAQFQANYFSFLSQLATAAQTTIQNIVIISLSTGSVIVNMSISTPFGPTSSQAGTINSNLNTLLGSNNIANMPVTSYNVVTNGGTLPSGGLSTTTIIILATVIPIGVLRTFVII